MLNPFPTVLVMDSTYKTNFYRMPLFEIVGVTSTNMTYAVDFVFLSFDQKDYFTWALEMLVGLLSSELNMPKVVVTDMNNALINVIPKVLHETYTILCYVHIGKNVNSKCITDCRLKVKPRDAKVDEKEVKEEKEQKHSDDVDKIMSAWKDLVESPIEDSYASVLLRFKDVCKPFPKFLAYVETTILNLVKEKFVRAWTNKVLHLGCRTTNVVESAHGKLKKYLWSSMGDLATCWDEIDKMLAI